MQLPRLSPPIEDWCRSRAGATLLVPRPGERPGLLSILASILLLLPLGCSEPPESGKEREPKAGSVSRPVRVVVVDDAPFATMLERQWSARTPEKLVLTPMSVEQLESQRQLAADIVIYPSECLGTLAQRGLIAPLPESVWVDADYDQTDVFDLQRNAQVRWGDRLYAFSFGSPLLVLMYRADLFAELGPEPPTTWAEYQTLAERLGDFKRSKKLSWPPNTE